MTRRLAIVLLLLGALGCSRARATEPPTVLPPLPVRLEEADRLGMLVLQLELEKAEVSFRAGAQAIASKYRLEKGDGMDFRTGAISRKGASK